MDFTKAAHVFQEYLKDYDQNNDKVRLKIVHTYGVVKQAEEVCRRRNLDEETVSLAKIIALLHDIGRFEQLKQFDSFEPTTMDHAAYGVQILFEEGMIRRFMPDDRWDEIIRTAIAKHSDFVLEGVSDPCALFHARLIRDADKLDNFRVKLEVICSPLWECPAKRLEPLKSPQRFMKQYSAAAPFCPLTGSQKWITGYPIWFISLT